MMIKKFISAITVSIVLVFTSCQNDNNDQQTTDNTNQNNQKTKLDASNGGVLNVAETEPINIIVPFKIKDAPTFRVATQIFEGLVKFDSKELTVKPAIAESWEVDDTKTIYTFKIRKGVYFHDDKCFKDGKGREVTANDIKNMVENVCGGSYPFAFKSTFSGVLKGADKYREAALNNNPVELEGIKLVNDYTIQFILEKPFSNFLKLMGVIYTSIIPQEAIDMYGDKAMVGTGPFIFSSIDDKMAVLVRNDNYYLKDKKGKKLPYLDGINIHFIDNKQKQLEMFNQGKIDVLHGLPAESIKEIVENQISDFQNKPPKYILETSPEMATNYIEFNCIKKPFNDKNVRLAIAYAINKNKLVESVLNGEAFGPGNNGIIPPVFKDYDVSKIVGHAYNLAKAKEYLKKAGYENGKNFPTVVLRTNSKSTENIRVATEIQKELLTNLNINVELEVSSLAQKIELNEHGNFDMSLSGWVVDMPSPENFLWLMYGENVPESLDESSFPNVSRYQNPEFDQLFKKILSESDEDKKMELIAKAEQMAINDAPVTPLWYNEKYRIVQSYVQGLNVNPMDLRDYSKVFMQKEVK